MAEEAVRKLDLGRVFSDTFAVARRQMAPLAAITFLLSTLPTLIGNLIQVAAGGQASPTGAVTGEGSILAAPFAIVGGILSLLVVAVQIRITVEDLEGQQIAWRAALRSCVRKMLPVLGVSVLLTLGIVAGSVLFLVPGMILATMWAVALPAVVEESSNVFQAFGRSRALTRGNRWRIFGFGVLVFLAVFIVQAVVMGAVSVSGLLLGDARPFALMIGFSLVSLVFSILISVAGTALYVQLRELKGSGRESVAQVFS